MDQLALFCAFAISAALVVSVVVYLPYLVMWVAS